MNEFENYNKQEMSDTMSDVKTENGAFSPYKQAENYTGQLADASRTLMTKVYGWMCAALAITALTALFCSNSYGFMELLLTNRVLFWGIMIAEFALVVGISAMIEKLSLRTATLLFILYSVVNGLTMSIIFLAYTKASIATTFFITAGMFGGMALYGTVTKKDLSSWGSYLFMALLGLILAGVVNIFWQNSVFHFIVSVIGVLIFVGLTAFDAQKIKNMLAGATDLGENNQKIALLGSLSLYLDFINMFLYLLRFFGRSK